MKHIIIATLFLLLTACVASQPPTPTAVPATATILAAPVTPSPSLTPAPNTPTAAVTQSASATPTTLPTAPPPTIPSQSQIEIEGVSLPPGFSLLKFADYDRPTSLAFDTHGRLWAASQLGNVTVFEDVDGNGRSDSQTQFTDGLFFPLGVLPDIDNGRAFISVNQHILLASDSDGDLQADELTRLVENLPVGLHQNNNLKFGPDGWIYMGVGSTCDACEEEDPRSATIMRFDPNSGAGEVVATGMRNPYDLAFHPLTDDLFATNNGRDDLGDDLPPEELNHIVIGQDYGFPDCWGVLEGPDCSGTTSAVAFFPAHASPNSLVFYAEPAFPEAYRGDAYVLVFGSWLIRGVQTGIQQVSLTPQGNTYSATQSWFARFPSSLNPLGLTVGPDGALYFGDYLNGGIYRISYGLPNGA